MLLSQTALQKKKKEKQSDRLTQFGYLSIFANPYIMNNYGEFFAIFWTNY